MADPSAPPADGPLTGATALVTGASSGIGAATARALAADGADVALAARRTERLDELAADIEATNEVTALPVPTDVTDPDQVDGMVESTVEAFGGLDAVVANAGIGRDFAVESMPTDAYREVMAVNCDGVFFTARAAIPYLRERAGNLIVISSFSGEYPRSGHPVYAATKWWTRGFAHSLAGALGGDDVGVTTINPAEVRTEFAYGDETNAERYPHGSVVEPADVAEAVVFSARQEPPTVVHELDLYRRDKLAQF